MNRDLLLYKRFWITIASIYSAQVRWLVSPTSLLWQSHAELSESRYISWSAPGLAVDRDFSLHVECLGVTCFESIRFSIWSCRATSYYRVLWLSIRGTHDPLKAIQDSLYQRVYSASMAPWNLAMFPNDQFRIVAVAYCPASQIQRIFYAIFWHVTDPNIIRSGCIPLYRKEDIGQSLRSGRIWTSCDLPFYPSQSLDVHSKDRSSSSWAAPVPC